MEVLGEGNDKCLLVFWMLCERLVVRGVFLNGEGGP